MTIRPRMLELTGTVIWMVDRARSARAETNSLITVTVQRHGTAWFKTKS